MQTGPWPRQVGSVLLRDPEPADVDVLLAFRESPEVTHSLLHPHVDAEAFRRQWSAVAASTTDFSCVAERDGAVAAMGFLELVDGVGQPGAPTRTEAEIGYIVDPRWWGRGVASDLARGLVDAAFEALRVRRVSAGCRADNHASVRVLEKTGLRREAHAVANTWYADAGWVDGYGYALLADEWRVQRAPGA